MMTLASFVIFFAALVFVQGNDALNNSPSQKEYSIGMFEIAKVQHTLGYEPSIVKSSRISDTLHPKEFQFSFSAQNKTFTILLEKNEDLIGPAYMSYIWDGEKLVPREEKVEHCYYHGHVENDPSSWVAVSTCNGFKGVVSAHEEFLGIEPTQERSLLEDEHMIFRLQDQDLKSVKALSTEFFIPEKDLEQDRKVKNETEEGKRGTNRYVELLFVNDASRAAKFSTVQLAEANSFSIANVVDGLYKNGPFANPIRIILSSQITLTSNPWAIPYTPWGEIDSSGLLTAFNTWRVGNAASIQPHDDAMLLTSLDFNNSTIGLAYICGMCSSSNNGIYKGGIVQVLNGATSAFTGQTVAHEMGHHLCMLHDGQPNNACPQSGNIMAPYQLSTTVWSSCSANYADNQFTGTCLGNVPASWGSPCGNGILDAGEDCDCGSSDCRTRDPCCNGATCKLVAGAVCSNSELCCQNCQFKPQGTLCRSSANQCDVADYCSGTSAVCVDSYSPAGGTCNWSMNGASGTGKCYKGNCRSQEYSCATWFNGAYASFCPNWGPCGNLVCKQLSSGNCYTWAEYPSVLDGSSCSSTGQCVSGTCVESSVINANDRGISIPPGASPAASPSRSPAASPSRSPVASPSRSPAASPSRSPAASPSRSPAASPSRSPGASPSRSPAASPSRSPVASPSRSPAASPLAPSGVCATFAAQQSLSTYFTGANLNFVTTRSAARYNSLQVVVNFRLAVRLSASTNMAVLPGQPAVATSFRFAVTLTGGVPPPAFGVAVIGSAISVTSYQFYCT